MLRGITNTFRQKSITSVQDIKLCLERHPFYDTEFKVKTMICRSDCVSQEVNIEFVGTVIMVNILLSTSAFNIVKKLRLLKISNDKKSYSKTSVVIENLDMLNEGIEALDIVNKVVSTDNKLSFNIYIDDGDFLSKNRANHTALGKYNDDHASLFFSMFHYKSSSELLATFSDRFKRLIRKRIDLFVNLYNMERSGVQSKSLYRQEISNEAAAVSCTIGLLGKDKLLSNVISNKNFTVKGSGYFGLYTFGVKLENFTRTHSSVCKGSISETAHRIKKLPSNFLEAANNYLALSHSDRAILAEKLLSVLLLIDKKMDEYTDYIHENNVSEFKTTLAFIEQVLSK